MYENPGGPRPICIPLPTPMHTSGWRKVKSNFYNVSRKATSWEQWVWVLVTPLWQYSMLYKNKMGKPAYLLLSCIFICQGTSTRSHRSDLFGLPIKLPPVIPV